MITIRYLMMKSALPTAIALWVLLNGTFVFSQDFFLQTAECVFNGIPSVMISSDLNQDGKKDLVLGGESATGQGLLTIYLNQGNDRFAEMQSLMVDRRPIAIRNADVDKDGLMDLIIANYEAKSVMLLMLGMDGQYKVKETFKLKASPLSLEVGDFNKDKTPDFAVTTPATKELHLFRGMGKGNFKPATVKTFTTSPLYLRAGDYANLGQTHLMITHENQTALTLLAAKETGGKWDIQTVEQDFLTHPFFADLGDIDGDGVEDAVIYNQQKQSLSVIFGETNGLFLDKVFPLELNVTPKTFLLDDFNNDNRIDLAVLDQAGRRAIIYSNILTTAETAVVPMTSRLTIICEKDLSKPPTAVVGLMSIYPYASMMLYSGEGQLIRKYFEMDSDLPDGPFTFEWSGTDLDENPVPDGIYVFYLKLGNITISRMVEKK